MNKLNALKKSDKGFTLVEIIVVLVIIAILAAIAIPSMVGFINSANEKTAIAEARSILVAAQTLASEQYAEGNLGDAAVSNITADELNELLGDNMVDDTEANANFGGLSLDEYNNKVNSFWYKKADGLYVGYSTNGFKTADTQEEATSNS